MVTIATILKVATGGGGGVFFRGWSENCGKTVSQLIVVVVVVVLLLTTKSHTNRSHVSNIFTCVVIYSINIFVFCKLLLLILIRYSYV